MHGYAHKSQTRERSDIPASVGREGVVPEGLIGRMDRGRQLAARFGRGLVKAMANVALDASVQFSCAHVHTLQFVVAVRSTKLEKHCAEPASNLQEHAMAGVHAAAPSRGRVDAGRP